MAEAGGWLVAVLVAVLAVVYGCATKAARQRKAHNSPTTAPDRKGVSAHQATVINVADADLDALWDDYHSDNPTDAIARAANQARDER